MGKEKLERGKNTRIVHQRSSKEGSASIVDNRHGGCRNYLSGAPLQRLEVDAMGGARQRKIVSGSKGTVVGGNVVQRTEDDDANGKFVYVADFHTDKDKYHERIPWVPKTIQFADYDEGEIASAGFSGCFMMAFHFNGEDIDPSFITSIQTTGDEPSLSEEKIYVAHVDNLVKKAAIDAERRGLITIEALFRPRNAATWDLMGSPDRNFANEQLRLEKDTSKERYGSIYAGIADLTANMGIDPASVEGGRHWRGGTFRQERIPLGDKSDYHNFEWINTRFVDYDASEMSVHTLASKAYIYARIILDGNCSEEQQQDAKAHMEEIKNNNPLALMYSCLEIVELQFEPNVLKYLSSLFVINEEIIKGIGLAGLAYKCACTIANVPEAATKSYVDCVLASEVASSIETLKKIRENNPKAIRGGSIIAMIKNEDKVEKELMKFYRRLV